jgi:hypothetical protein
MENSLLGKTTKYGGRRPEPRSATLASGERAEFQYDSRFAYHHSDFSFSSAWSLSTEAVNRNLQVNSPNYNIWYVDRVENSSYDSEEVRD